MRSLIIPFFFFKVEVISNMNEPKEGCVWVRVMYGTSTKVAIARPRESRDRKPRCGNWRTLKGATNGAPGGLGPSSKA